MASAYQYIKYKAFSRHKTGHGIHSPFVFNLVTRIFNDSTPYYCFEPIEKIRNEMLSSQVEIEVNDLGAGSRKLGNVKRKVSKIAEVSAVQKKYGMLLFKLANEFKPKNIIELGTSLGIGSLYLSSYSKKANLYTIEGCENTAKIARKNFQAMDAYNINLTVGNFDKRLPEVLKITESVDMAFFDGNHRKEPTIKYFNMCLEKKNNESVFIFDDIHWSKDMYSCWCQIKKHPDVTVTIDIFQMGMVFFRKELQRQDYVIRF